MQKYKQNVQRIKAKMCIEIENADSITCFAVV